MGSDIGKCALEIYAKITLLTFIQRCVHIHLTIKRMHLIEMG